MPPKRTKKNALLIILDCGPDSAITTTKDDKTFFSRAKECVLRIYENKLFEDSNDELCLVLMGPHTQNRLYDQMEGDAKDTYKNLAEVLEMKRASWESARYIDQRVQLCETQADWMSALILGLDILRDSTERCYDVMKIILMTTFASSVETASEETKKSVIDTIKGDNEELGAVELIVINDNIEYDREYDVHCDSSHFSQKIEKSQSQESSEKLITEITKDVNGVLCNLENAELQILFFDKKRVKGRAYPYTLQIGSHIKIEVAEYVKVESAQKFLESWKTMHSITEEDVKKATKYYHNDVEIKKVFLNTKNKPQDKRMDDEVEIMTGYMYGSTPVPFEPNLKQSFGEKGLICIGFSDRKYLLSEHMSAKGCHVVLPQLKSKSSVKKFGALVRALHEMNFVIIARKVYNRASSPQIVAMIPEFTEDRKAFLTMIGLHFKEDTVNIVYPSLENTKKHQPTEEQYAAMEELINSMDLMTAGNEKSGNAEAFSLNKTLNPVNQHVCRMISQRALRPNEPLQQISEELTEIIDVPKKIKEMSRDTLLKAKELFKLEEVKKLSRIQLLQERLKKIEDTTTTTSATEQNVVSVDAQIEHVGTVTPDEDFLFLYDKGILDFSTAAKQLQAAIIKITFHSFSIQKVRIMKGIFAYREIAKDIRPNHYNEWIMKYKEELITKGLQDIFTEIIIKEDLGLIVSLETNLSTVSHETGQEFYRIDHLPATTMIAQENNDDDDVMGLIE